MKTEMTDAGVKVHIHHEGDIPYVQYVGTAAALSSHTYLAITLKESVSLGEPYGSCSSSKLEMFPNQNYSQFKCNQQCLTKAMAEKCGCKDHYMPGNASFCTLEKHINCKVDIGELKCPCPSSCHMTAFSSQASFSSLSKHGVSALLSDKAQFEKGFYNALNYRYRMQPKLAERVISNLDGFAKALESLFVFLKRETAFGQTSVTFHTSEANKELTKIAKSDIKEALSFLPDLLEEFSCAEKYLNARDTELAVAQAKVHRFIELIDELNDNRGAEVATKNDLLTKMASDLKDTFLVLLLPFEYHVKCYGNSTRLDQFIPVTLLPNKKEQKSCDETFNIVQNTLRSIPFSALMPNANKTILEYSTRVKQLDIQVVDDFLNLHRNCTNSYSGLLQEMKEWQESVSTDVVGHTIGSDFLFEKEILMAKDIFNWFKQDLVKEFKDNRMTVIQLANAVTSERFHTFFGEMARFKKKLDDTCLTFLSQDVNLNGPINVKSWYRKVLSYMANLQPYVSKKLGLRKKAREMKIWQKPQVNLDGMHLVDYAYDPQEVWRAWPPTVNVKNFYTFQSSRVLQIHVGDFFRQLADKLDEFEVQYQALQSRAINAFSSLNRSMAAIQQSSVIDEQFILNNFLKLDVYYGELTHELIEQTPAYTLSNFFSDMGGYLGLLLGASVLTICELLDVIFYNAFQKCHTVGSIKMEKKVYV